MAEWLTRLHIAHPTRAALLTGLATVLALVPIDVIYEGGFRPSVVLLVFCGFWGAMVGTLLAPSHLKAAFPSELDIDTKMSIWRTVRDGGPVDDPTIASALAHHANWVLQRPGPKPLANAVGLMITVLLMAAVILTINDVQTGAWVCVLLAGLLALAIPGIPRMKKHRRNAETVHAQALQLLTAGHAGMTAHPASLGRSCSAG